MMIYLKNIHKYNNCESISNSNNNSYFIKKKRKRNNLENSKQSFSSDLEFCHSESFNHEDPFNINLKKNRFR